jgi:hypothetical protein
MEEAGHWFIKGRDWKVRKEKLATCNAEIQGASQKKRSQDALSGDTLSLPIGYTIQE